MGDQRKEWNSKRKTGNAIKRKTDITEEEGKSKQVLKGLEVELKFSKKGEAL